MNDRLTGLLGALAMCAAALAPTTAAAQSTWNLGTYATTTNACNPNSSNPATASCSSNGVTATMSAWSNTGSGGAFVQYGLQAYDPSGFGTKSNTAEGDPQHAFDNLTSLGGSVEMMLINFSSKVALTNLAIGWWNTDADISVYRYTGTATTASAVAGSALPANVETSTSLGTSWQLVSSQDVDAATQYDNPNTSAVDTSARLATLTNPGYSSWWIVSTYFGAADSSKGLDKGNDAYKLLGFAANTCAGTVNNAGACVTVTPTIPEPGSLAMAGLALVAAFTTRRRRPAAAA